MPELTCEIFRRLEDSVHKMTSFSARLGRLTGQIQIDRFNITQVSKLFDRYVFYPFYLALESASKHSSSIRWIAPLVARLDAIAGFIQMVASVGEAVIKGVGNVIFGVCARSFYFLKLGSYQILGGVFIGTLGVPLLFCRAGRIAYTFAKDPNETTSDQVAKLSQKLV